MVTIKKATAKNIAVLASLANKTFSESHGGYIDDKKDLLNYVNENFSVSKTEQDFNNPKNLFYIIYVEGLPAGYAKLIVNEHQENVVSKNNCRLERIYILNDFIPLKIGQQLLHFLEAEAKILQLDTMWLSVYIKNYRAIRFYERNEFKNVGEYIFKVNGKGYENIIFSKKIAQ
ncbi:GNAT family N-acetyltransferase [Aureibaculum sp. A20]|uniref:GNAT family N-acetyltransferase n=1 Tax=Aureibaculum flavum TaxID=2795986 RepID=A0ABS0WM72_9FLAO|nr:GNAT family N-acetyltransferase [Aureibaculum flavum]MBJ2173051.1 GNAT family N-acetyltransferase [Aureibaculum flavum]